MRKTRQIAHDDCLAAALASLLDLPLGVVPIFTRSKDGAAQLRLTQRWLSKIGFTLIEIRLKGKTAPWLPMAVATPCIVIVKSQSRQWEHATVGSIDKEGIRVIHDPAHPEPLEHYETLGVMLLTHAIKPGQALEQIRLLRE